MTRPSVLGIDLSHVPDSGADDSMSAAVLKVACAMARVVVSPTDHLAIWAALAGVKETAEGLGRPYSADLADALLALLSLTDEHMSEGMKA